MTRGEKVGSLVGHENRVSCLGVSNDGISLCTGSWDSLVSIHSPYRQLIGRHLQYPDTAIDWFDSSKSGHIKRLGDD